jgi:hypothetical protein
MPHSVRTRARTFLLTALPATALFLGLAGSAHAVTFSNTTPITINDATSHTPNDIPAASTPYPSSIAVSGVVGTVTKVTATFHGFHHTCSTDVDTLLVGPGGQDSLLMSDAGDCGLGTTQPAPIDLTFEDGAPLMLCLNTGQPLLAGTYAPTNDPTTPRDCTEDDTNPDVFDAPAPAGPYVPGLGVFNGVNPNGTWNLYTMDQFSEDSGAIDGGWSLDLTIPAATLTSAPGITGKPDVGKALTAVSGTIGNGGAPSYQWSRCNLAGAGCTVIGGATQGTYTPTRADKGHTLIVTETGVTSGGSSAPLASKATSPVGPAVISSGGTRKSQSVLKQKGLLASIKSNVGGSLVASATVSVPNAAKTVRFKTVRKKLKAGRKTTVRLGLSKSARNAIAAALANGKKLRAKVTLTVTDAGGGRSTKRVTVRLK